MPIRQNSRLFSRTSPAEGRKTRSKSDSPTTDAFDKGIAKGAPQRGAQVQPKVGHGCMRRGLRLILRMNFMKVYYQTEKFL